MVDPGFMVDWVYWGTAKSAQRSPGRALRADWQGSVNLTLTC